MTEEVIFFVSDSGIDFWSFPIDGSYNLPSKNRASVHKNQNNTSHEIRLYVFHIRLYVFHNFEIQIFNIVLLKIVTPDFFLKVGVTVDPPVFFMLFYFSCKQPLKTGKDRSVSLPKVLEVLAVNMVSSCRVVTYSQRLGFILLVATCPDYKGVGWGLEYPGKLWSEHYISCDAISPD